MMKLLAFTNGIRLWYISENSVSSHKEPHRILLLFLVVLLELVVLHTLVRVGHNTPPFRDTAELVVSLVDFEML